jgi:dolichyl-phosphate beta-glucosyltransferase
MSIELSVVIPAYNEAVRLPPFLAAVRTYLATSGVADSEVIVVDDGSRDGLSDRIIGLSSEWPCLSLICHPTNLGKGAAVRTGMLAARGRLVLFADADGATPIEEERKLRATIEAGADLAVGSRLLGGLEVERPWHRKLIGRLFAGLVHALLPVPVRDTQCGFKMFRRELVPSLFAPCSESGYLFDLYILASAVRLGYRIAEVPIRWVDIPGSKVRLFCDPWWMLLGSLRLRRSLAVTAMHAGRVDPASDATIAAGGSQAMGFRGRLVRD